jgi:hypothetical protein
VLESDLAASGLGQRHRIGRGDDARLGVLQLDQPLHRAGCALHLAPHLAERCCRHAHVDRIEQELAEFAAGHRAADHVVRADPEHERDGAEDQHRGDRSQRRAHARALHRRIEGVLDRRAEAVGVQGLEREGLHRLDGVQRLVGEAAGVGDAVLRGARELAHAPPEDDERHDQQRNQHDDDGGELQARHREHDQAAPP